MISYLKHYEIDKQRWDDCINQSDNGLVYAMSWYLDMVCPDWEALIKDDYQYVFPLTRGKKYGIHYLFQPYFAQQLGVFSVHPVDTLITDEFIRSIPRKYRLVEINLNEFQEQGTENPERMMKDNFNLTLALSKPYEELYSNYSQNTRRNLKKAREAKIRIADIVNENELIQMFRKNRGKDIEKMNDSAYSILHQIVTECKKRGMIKISGAFTNDKLCAGVLFLSWKQRHIFLFSASNADARKNGAMSLIIDTFIRQHAGYNETLDFEGSNDKNLARFYHSFGSAGNYYSSIRINRLPWIVKTIKTLLTKK